LLSAFTPLTISSPLVWPRWSISRFSVILCPIQPTPTPNPAPMRKMKPSKPTLLRDEETSPPVESSTPALGSKVPTEAPPNGSSASPPNGSAGGGLGGAMGGATISGCARVGGAGGATGGLIGAIGGAGGTAPPIGGTGGGALPPAVVFLASRALRAARSVAGFLGVLKA